MEGYEEWGSGEIVYLFRSDKDSFIHGERAFSLKLRTLGAFSKR
jgi:hypothetical protein